MKKMFTYDYPRPMLTVDAVIFNKSEKKLSILLVERRNEPYINYWALPGGFIEMHETLVQSMQRELYEETGLQDVELSQFKTYGDPGRDPRGRTITVVFYGYYNNQNIRAGDDAKDVQWFEIDNLPKLAFDHKNIILDILGYLKTNFNNI